MKRCVNKITLIVLILCISMFTQGCIKTEYEEEETKEKSNIAQISDEKIYKLPCVIEYTSGSNRLEDVHKVLNWNFVFSDIITESDVWYLETNSSNLITKATYREHGASYYDVCRFEYDANNRVVRVTEGYSSLEDGKSVEEVDVEYKVSYENNEMTIIVNLKLANDGKFFEHCIHKIAVNDNYNVVSYNRIDGESTYFWSPPDECKYDDYGNIISVGYYNGKEMEYTELRNIDYDGDKIVSAEVQEAIYKYTYDSDGYLSEFQDEYGVFNYRYKKFTKEEYYALKKLSVLWFPATFTYFKSPCTDFVNYYKY